MENNNKQQANSNFSHINDLISEALDNLEAVANNPKGINGLTSGFKNLDIITSGWQNGDLIVIAARPAMGKTAFIVSMIANMAIENKIPIGHFSLEISNNQITNRFLANVCEIPGMELKTGRLQPHQWELLDYKIKTLYDAPIFIDSPYTMSIQTLCEKAKEMVEKEGVKAIFVDYVQLLTVVDKYADNRYNEINYISRKLKALARELNIPIFAISQMNRGIENRIGADGKRPQLIDLRDSGTLCDDADLVCFIHRPEYYKIYEDERGNSLFGLAEFIVAKHRNGAIGDVSLRFKSDFGKFQDLEEPSFTTPSDNPSTEKDFDPPF